MNWKDQIAIRAYRKVQMRAWRKKHPGRAAAQKRAWRKKNKKRARALSLAHYYKYREKILEQKKAWYWGDHKANKIKHAKRMADYRSRWREKYNAHMRKYRKENPDYFSVYNKIRSKTRVGELSNSYVAQQLGMRVGQCPKVLLEAKRVLIMLRRATKEKHK